MYAAIISLLVATAIFFAGFKSGEAVTKVEWQQERAATDAKVIVVNKVVEKEVPKIVERVVTKTVTVEKEVERVVVQVEKAIPADCVLPDNYGMFLVAAARGLDPEAPGTSDALAGAYGCREVLAATLADLRAGWINTARLDGLQEWERAVERANAQGEGRGPTP